MSEDRLKTMTQAPLARLICKLALPAMLSLIITSVYNTADTFFISKLNDNSATAAVSVVFSIMSIIQAGGSMVGSGAISIISRCLGKNDREEANRMAATGLLIAVVFGLILFAANIFIDPILRFMGATESILPHARKYGGTILFAAPVMTSAVALNHMLRAEGSASYGMFGIVSGGVLNMVLDPIFIFEWGLGLGVQGAALATAVSQCVSLVILLLPYIRKRTQVTIGIKNISFSFKYWLGIFKLGIPSLLRQGLASISLIVLNRTLAVWALDLSDAAIAAMGIESKIFMIVHSLIMGFGQGYQPVAGYSYGAGLYNRLRSAVKFVICVNVSIMLAASVFGMIFAENILSIFGTGGADPDVVRIGAAAFRAHCIAMPLVPVTNIASMTFQMTGKAGRSSLIASCRQGICFFPMILLLPHLFGINGVLYTQAAADLLTAIISIPLLCTYLRKLDKEA